MHMRASVGMSDHVKAHLLLAVTRSLPASSAASQSERAMPSLPPISSTTMSTSGSVASCSGSSYQVTADWGVYVAAENLGDAAIETGQTADHVKSYDEPRVFRIGLRFRE